MLSRPDAVPRVIHEMPNLVHYPIKIRAGFGTVPCHRRTRTDGRKKQCPSRPSSRCRSICAAPPRTFFQISIHLFRYEPNQFGTGHLALVPSQATPRRPRRRATTISISRRRRCRYNQVFPQSWSFFPRGCGQWSFLPQPQLYAGF